MKNRVNSLRCFPSFQGKNTWHIIHPLNIQKPPIFCLKSIPSSGIKNTPTIHLVVKRNSIPLVHEKPVLRYEWLPSISCLKFMVWKLIPNLSTLNSATSIRNSLLHPLNGWNPYHTGLTVSRHTEIIYNLLSWVHSTAPLTNEAQGTPTQ
jgi:hypothetical protein